MRHLLGRILALAMAAQPLLAYGQDDLKAKDAQSTEPTEVKTPEAKGGDAGQVVDLNQIDLEQVEENWDSSSPTSSVGAVGADRNLQLKDIVQPSSEYSYASFGKPDPFLAPDLGAFRKSGGLSGMESTGSGGDGAQGVGPLSADGKEIKITTPLQGYPLNDLKIRGNYQLANGEIRVLIQTPKNEGVVVKVGDPISSGKILSIEKDKVIARLYKIRADGVREYEDQQLSVQGVGKINKGVIRLEPGKEPQFLRPNEPVLPATPLGDIGNGKSVPPGGENLLKPRFPATPGGVPAAAAAAVPGAVPGAAPAAVNPAGALATPAAVPAVAPAPTDAIPAGQDPRALRPGSVR